LILCSASKEKPDWESLINSSPPIFDKALKNIEGLSFSWKESYLKECLSCAHGSIFPGELTQHGVTDCG
jgi:hypothetical protein